MESVATSFQYLVAVIQLNLHFTVGIILALWGINLLNALLGYRLNVLGIYPRSIHGLIGIPLSPFLHGNFSHVFFNSIPLFVFMNFVLLAGYQEFYCVSIIIIFLSGFAIWLFGRRAIHIGASSLIMGYLGYLLLNAYYHPTVTAIFVIIITIYYFSGLLLSFIPTAEAGISWEGHLFGLLAGVTANYLCPIIENNWALYLR